MMQSTAALILQYGRTQHGTKLARRCRKRLRSRARHGDAIARRFRGTKFDIIKDIQAGQRMLREWLGL